MRLNLNNIQWRVLIDDDDSFFPLCLCRSLSLVVSPRRVWLCLRQKSCRATAEIKVQSTKAAIFAQTHFLSPANFIFKCMPKAFATPHPTLKSQTSITYFIFIVISASWFNRYNITFGQKRKKRNNLYLNRARTFSMRSYGMRSIQRFVFSPWHRRCGNASA